MEVEKLEDVINDLDILSTHYEVESYILTSIETLIAPRKESFLKLV